MHETHLITFYWTDGEAEESKSDGCTSAFQPADLESTINETHYTLEETLTDKPALTPSILQAYSIKTFICLQDFT